MSKEYHQEQNNTTNNNSESFLYEEETPDHHYRTEIPNFILDAELSPFDLSVYLHLKRIAGDKGKCWQSNESLAKKIGCCEKKFRKSIKNLIEGKNKFNIPLIKQHSRKTSKGGKDTNLRTIINVWGFNGKFFRKEGGVSVPHTDTHRYHIPIVSVPHTDKEELSQEDPCIKETNVNFRSSLSQKKRISEDSLDDDQKDGLCVIRDFVKQYKLSLKDKDLIDWIVKFGGDHLMATLVLMIKQKNKVKNQGGWIQDALYRDHVGCNENIEVNREFAEKFKNENRWGDLHITKKYCTLGDSGIDLQFTFDPETFKQLLTAKYSNIFRKLDE